MADSVSQAMPVRVVVPNSNGIGFSDGVASGSSYQLAGTVGGTGDTLAGNTGSNPVSNVVGGSYVFDVQLTGTSVRLEALASDGITWRTIYTATTSGSTGVVLGQNATVRVYNPNGTSDTVWASLS